jgi:hypothetical protein
MYNEVHLDEKWFYLVNDGGKYILTEGTLFEVLMKGVHPQATNAKKTAFHSALEQKAVWSLKKICSNGSISLILTSR